MADQSEAKAITNIYYDCLERIFDFLDLEDLLNVGRTCKRLQIAAAAKFGDDFGKVKIRFCNWLYYYHRDSGINIDKYDGGIDVIGLKLWLPFLRCFGRHVSMLRVDYRDVPETRMEFLDHCINHYCADTLEGCTLLETRALSVKNFTKQFKKVNSVSISGAPLRNQLPFFNKMFPNMHRLELGRVSIDEITFGVRFPQLRDLTLIFYSGKGNGNLTYGNAKKILHANQHITGLCIENTADKMTLTMLLDLIEENRSIVSLSAQFEHGIEVNTAEWVRLASTYPLMQVLCMTAFRITARDAIFLIQQLSSLNFLKLHFANRFERESFMEQLTNEWGECDKFLLSDKGRFYIQISR